MGTDGTHYKQGWSAAKLAGYDEGFRQGKCEAIRQGLEAVWRFRFASLAEALLPHLQDIDDPEDLMQLLELSVDGGVENVRNWLAGRGLPRPSASPTESGRGPHG